MKNNLKLTKFEIKLISTSWFKLLVKYLKKFHFPFFFHHNMYEVCKLFYIEWRDAEINTEASAIAYRFILALPPTLLFFFTILPYLPLKGVQETLISTINIVIPNKSSATVLIGFLDDFLNKEKTGLLSLSIITSLYFASNGMNVFLKVLDNYESKNFTPRSNFVRRIKALQLTLLMLFEILLLLVFILAQKKVFLFLLQYFHLDFINYQVLVYNITLILLIFVLFLSIAILYFFGPSIKQKWRFFNIGMLFSGIFILIFTIGLFYAANHFVNYNQIYGSIGSLFLFLVWLFSSVKILLIGFTFNYNLDKLKEVNAST